MNNFCNVEYLSAYTAADVIRKQRTIDAVPVVRCKDCERRDKNFVFVSEKDTISCPYMEAFMPADGFCSYGERKDGDGNG